MAKILFLYKKLPELLFILYKKITKKRKLYFSTFVHSSQKDQKEPYFATNRLFFSKAVYFCTNFQRKSNSRQINIWEKHFAGNLFILKESLFSYSIFPFYQNQKFLTVHFIWANKLPNSIIFKIWKFLKSRKTIWFI